VKGRQRVLQDLVFTVYWSHIRARPFVHYTRSFTLREQ
jgi:hypothetical protein